jgi:two-component system cell cycle sensor histidine kinase/response regulator CckA
VSRSRGGSGGELTSDDDAGADSSGHGEQSHARVERAGSDEAGGASPVIQDMLQGALNQMNTAVLLWDEQWRLVFTNAVGRTMFEVRDIPPVGRTIWELNPNWESTPFAETAQHAATAKVAASKRHYSTRLRRWFEMVAYPTTGGLVIYMQDVTTEETARERLDVSVGRLRSQAALLDAARDAIFVRDLDHRITYWNQGAERLYGWTADEALGRTSRELIYHDPHLFDQAQAELWGVGHWAGELEHLTKDGRAVVVSCRWQVLTDDDGRPYSVMCVNSDITQYKREQAKRYRDQRMESLGMLAGGIAHDLNNVLTPILITAQLLAADEEDDQRRALLDTMQSGVERGADMIRQVLSFARGEEVQRALVDVGALVDQLHSFARRSLPPAIRLETDAPADLWNVTGDGTQLLQVLMNLVTNARDAMAGEGVLTIRTRNATDDDGPDGAPVDASVHGWVVVEVEDTGCGMDQATIDRLFEPFFTTKPIGSGTGLGLSTSLAIAQGHGGDIDVYSERGRGTRFRLRLPATTAGSATAPTADESTRGRPRGRGELVLVVDDEATIRGIVQQALEKDGYRTVSAGDGIEAVRVLQDAESPVDLVLTDMMMPGMDGAATAAYLYRHHPGIPVIAASGLTANETVAQAANPGVRSFLAKPFSRTELLAAVDDALHGGAPARTGDTSTSPRT